MHTQEMVYFYRNMSQQCVSILYFATGWFRKRISECWFISWGGIKNYLSLEHIFITWTHIYRLNTYLSLEHIFITWTHIYHLNTHLSLEHIRIAWTHIYRLNAYLSLEHIYHLKTYLSLEHISQQRKEIPNSIWACYDHYRVNPSAILLIKIFVRR